MSATHPASASAAEAAPAGAAAAAAPSAPAAPAATRTHRRVLLLGATGTIGRATALALRRRGHEVVCFGRTAPTPALQAGCQWRQGDVLQPGSVARDGLAGEPFDALVSCLASRTGVPADAWAVDHRAHHHALAAAVQAGVPQMVLLSALCVQKPQLAFQHAKLAFEAELQASPLRWSIVRPTAFFKSLSGQVARVQAGKPFVVFGDGRLTACKPIADDDLADYLANCLDDPDLQQRILPIGGPGPALTPLDQAQLLSELLGRPVPLRHVPLRLMDLIVGTLQMLGRVLPAAAAKAELARIGRYYATESMLVWDATAGRYSAEATPSTGRQTLRDYYGQLCRGEAAAERGEHAVF